MTLNVASGNNLSKAGPFERVLVAKANGASGGSNSNSAGDMSFTAAAGGKFTAGDYISGTNIRKNTRVTFVTSNTVYVSRPLTGDIGTNTTISVFESRQAAGDGPPGFELKAGSDISITASSQNGVGAAVLEINATGGALDINGLTAIGSLADADTFPVDDGDGGTNRKATMTQLKTYMQNGLTFPVTAVSGGDANRIATFSSATALAGDADLTFDGTIFSIGDSTDTAHQLRLFSKLTNDAALKIAHEDTHTTLAHTTEMLELSGTYDDTTNNGTTQNLLGIRADVNVTGNHASGTKTGTGILVDVDGTTTGTTTGFGLDVDVAGFDTNYSAVFRNGLVGIGGLPSSSDGSALNAGHANLLELITPSSYGQALYLTSTHTPGASNTNGPVLRFNAKRDGSEAGAANDILGFIEWFGMSHANNNHHFARIDARATAVASASETGAMTFQVATSTTGAVSTVMSILGGTNALDSTVQIHGNLQVEGTTTTVNSTTLLIDDKNIELAHSPSGSLGDDAAVDGGGITLRSSDGDKTFNWVDSTDAWTSSENLELASGKSLIIGSASMNETDLEKLDDITDGTAAANKALVVDASKDIGTLGTLTAANLTANTLVTTPALSVDSVAVLDTSSSSSQSFDCVSGGGAAKDLATYAYATYRTVKFIGQIVDNTSHETDCFEVLVTYDGADGPGATSDVHMTTYAYISSNDTPMGTLAAVKSGTNIALQFTNTVADFTGSFAVTATQLIKQ